MKEYLCALTIYILFFSLITVSALIYGYIVYRKACEKSRNNERIVLAEIKNKKGFPDE